MILSSRIKKIFFPTLFIFLGAGMWTYVILSDEKGATGQVVHNPKRVFLLGASVGEQWNLPEFSKRMQNERLVLESAAVYQYDKTEALEEVLMRPNRKFRFTRTYLKGLFRPAPQPPDMIIIKECAAYFPGDMEAYKELVRGWVKKVKEAKIEVVLATVVPVTRKRAEKQKGKIEGIREYNDWIREYAKQEQIGLLDLEAVLRTEDEARYLKEEYAVEDGLHLNKKAYDVLDRFVQNTFDLKS